MQLVPSTRLLVLCLIALLASCRGSEPGAAQSNLRTVVVEINGKPFTLEVADNDQTRAYGLMNRESMPADHGMIFVFPDERPRSFWMKDTLIPLDIIYLDAKGEVVSTAALAARDRSGVPSARPAKYAIELNRGAAAGVRAGDYIIIPPEAREPHNP